MGDSGFTNLSTPPDNHEFPFSHSLLWPRKPDQNRSDVTNIDLTNASVTSMHYQSLAQELKNAVTTPTASFSAPAASVSSINHMQKLIRELLDTENTYCQSLEQLVKLYLEPLSQNNFLTETDVKVLFGSILQIIDAQNEFRSELTEVGEHILGDCTLLLERCTKPAINSKQAEPSVNELGVGYIADCFLKHCSNFRNYSVSVFTSI